MRRRVLPAATFWPLAKPSAHHRPLLRPRNHRRLRRAAARSSAFSPQVCFHASRDSSPWPLDATELPFVGAEAHVASPNCAPSSWRSPSLLSLNCSPFQSHPQPLSPSLSIFTLSISVHLNQSSLSQSRSIFKYSLNLSRFHTVYESSHSVNFCQSSHTLNLCQFSVFVNLCEVSISISICHNCSRRVRPWLALSISISLSMSGRRTQARSRACIHSHVQTNRQKHIQPTSSQG